MAKEKPENYNDLIFELGDLARERLADRRDMPRSMERVFKAEAVVLDGREALAALEQQLNEKDAEYQAALAAEEAEVEEKKKVVLQWKKVVDSIQGRVNELRKKVTSARGLLRYEKKNVKKAEQRHADLELVAHHDPRKIALSKENLKKLRLLVMRRQRDLGELEQQFNEVLTPHPGQPGAAGILAHKRLLEIEDLAEEREIEHKEEMAELDQLCAAKEGEIQAAEDYLDQALFLLGEECYQDRISDPALVVFYPRLDKAGK